MLRDTRKNAAYFQKYLDCQNKRIASFKTKADELIKKDGEDHPGVIKIYSFIANFLKDKFIASYSSGDSKDELDNIFVEMVKYYNRLPEICYSDLLDLASICVLLKPEEDCRTIVTGLLSNCIQKDMLLDGLHNYIDSGTFDTNAAIEFVDIYGPLYPVIKSADKTTKENLLCAYVNDFWYNANKESAWFDAHLSTENTYVGYWCFVGAALAVALDLDLEIIRRILYIPSDFF